MYWKHFGLSEDPFSLTADRRFLFLTDAHRDVLATLRETMETERGFAALIGAPGVGKTTLLYELTEQLRESTIPVFVVQAHIELVDILQLLLKELGQEATKVDPSSLHQRFAEALKQVAVMGKRCLLVIDEVQALNPAMLETIRLLSNIELGRKKIVEAVFAGQSDFEELLGRPNLQVLKQRIAAYGRLKPFTRDESRAYVLHRLHVAGGGEVFTPEALDVLAELSHGVARTINIYAFQALHAAVKKSAKSADSDITRKAIYEFEGWPLPAAAPVLARRAEPAPETKPAPRVRDEDDDYFESGKDAGLQALLATLRSDRSSNRETELPETPVMPAITPIPAAAPAVAKAEPIAFSIAAVLKSTEAMPSVNRTAAAVAPAYAPVSHLEIEEKVEEVPVAEPAPSKAPVKAPMLIVPAPAAKPSAGESKPEVVAVSAKRATKATTTSAPQPWPGKQAQLVVAITLGLLMLVGAAAFAYKRSSFNTASAAPTAEVHPVVAPAAAVTAPASASTSTTNAATESAGPSLTKPKPRAEEQRQPTPAAAVAKEITAGKALHLNDAESAPAASVSLGAIGQPNLGSALAVSAQPVALARNPEQVKPAVVITQPKPAYPEMAARLGLAGTVVLRVQINAQGKPTKVDVVSGPPILAAAAKNTVMSAWRFSPATIDGKKVESESEVRINFRGTR